MFALIERLDSNFVTAIKNRAWGTYVMLWLGSTLGLAAVTFTAFFVAMVGWGALEPFFVTPRSGQVLPGLSWATVWSAVRMSELESLINGSMAFFGAPLLMSIQWMLGDYDHERAPPPEVGLEG